jgi:uncharacterized membrane protein YphA (DoxX/SURF4 family)
MNTAAARLHSVKVVARSALGLIWFYEGIVPKLLFLRVDQIDLVQRSGLVWRSPEWTLHAIGVAQIAVGLWLLGGVAERAAALVATAWMCVLIVLVASGVPALLTDPYGALVKDLSLIASAYTVWVLSGLNHGARAP